MSTLKLPGPRITLEIVLLVIVLALIAIASLWLWIYFCGAKHAAAFQRRLAYHNAKDRLRAAISYTAGKDFKLDDAYLPADCPNCGHRMRLVRYGDGHPYGMVCTRIAYFCSKIDFCGYSYQFKTPNALEVERTAAFLGSDEIRWPPDKA